MTIFHWIKCKVFPTACDECKLQDVRAEKVIHEASVLTEQFDKAMKKTVQEREDFTDTIIHRAQVRHK